MRNIMNLWRLHRSVKKAVVEKLDKHTAALPHGVVYTAFVAILTISAIIGAAFWVSHIAFSVADLQGDFSTYQADVWKTAPEKSLTVDEKKTIEDQRRICEERLNECDRLIPKSQFSSLKNDIHRYFQLIDELFELRGSDKNGEAYSFVESQMAPLDTSIMSRIAKLDVKFDRYTEIASVCSVFFVFFVLFIAVIAIITLLKRYSHLQSQFVRQEAFNENFQLTQNRINAYMSNTLDVLIGVSSDDVIAFTTPAATKQWMYKLDSLVGASIYDIISPMDHQQLSQVINACRMEPERIRIAELSLRMGNGDWRSCEVILVDLSLESDDATLILTCRDISERKSYQDRLEFQAFHDLLTELPNRALFLQILHNTMERVERTKNNVAIIFIDLDEFKLINENLGHIQGDYLLIHVANRLQACIRAGDTVARWTGDEFVILMEDVDDSAPLGMAERILSVLNTTVFVGGREVYISASIGIAIARHDDRSPEDLLRDAETAMHKAKVSGRSQLIVFDEAMNVQMAKRWELENGLRDAIKNNEFRVYYQPIVSLDTGVVTEVEALIRWISPDGALISPAEFIPLAEETGQIREIGIWVLAEACRQANNWRCNIPRVPPLVVSVNLSARQLREPDLVENVSRVIRESGLPVELLKLEITESVAMTEGDSVMGKLNDLRALGLRLAVDDFGTGYSSMSYLSTLPVETLKIDRSFISRMLRSQDDYAIVEAIVSLAKMLHLSITSEGVELPEEAFALRQLGCDRAQGYYYARPLPADAITQMLRDGIVFTIPEPTSSVPAIDALSL